MINVNKNNGFTLIEIIVGINIGFLLLTVIVTFFLFSTKFVATTTKKMDERQNINGFLSRLETTLRKADHFYLERLDTNVVCIVNDSDTIVLNNNSFSLMNIYEIKDFKEYSSIIEMQPENQSSISDEIVKKSLSDLDQNATVYSGDIKSISIEFSKSNYPYSFCYINPNISINRFRNITN